MDLIQQFEALELSTLRHADHVRLTCAYLARYDEAATFQRLLAGLQRFAAAKGQPEKFHYTVTRAWLELILDARRQHPGASSGEELMALCPMLADPAALRRFYSHGVLFSDDARTRWVAPDLRPIAARL